MFIDLQEQRQLFILRRAFWIKKVRRADLIRAFSISPNQASADMKRAVFERFRSHLGRIGSGHSGVVPLDGVQTHPEATASVMLNLFARSADFKETGIDPTEFHRLVYVAPASHMNDELLEDLMSACIHKHAVDILYVGLKKGETAKWRSVLPNGMEFTGKFWRLIAQDLKDENKQKIYILPRILKTARSNAKIKRVIFQDISSAPSRYQVTLNSDMTTDQFNAISNELGIKNNVILMNSRNLYEFQKLYCDDRTNIDQLAWPIINQIKKV